MSYLLILPILFSLVSSLLYLFKFIKTKDFGYIGMFISRALLFIFLLYYNIRYLDSDMVVFLCLLSFILVAEITKSLVYVFSRKYMEKIEKYKDSIVDNKIKEYGFKSGGFFITNIKGDILYSNKHFLEIFGYSKEQSRKLTFSDLIYQDDLWIWKENLKNKLNKEAIVTVYDIRIIKKDGSIKNATIVNSIVTNGHTSIVGTVFVKEA